MEDAIIAVSYKEKTDYIILLRCDFTDESKKGFYGYIMLFPRMDGLKTILNMLDAAVN